MERAATTSEVAARLGLASATVQKYAREGRIPFDTTPGGHRRFNMEEVRAVLSSGDMKPDQESVSIQNQQARSPATAVILTALPVEYDAVRSRLESCRPVRLAGGTRFEVGQFEGTYLEWEVAVAEIGEGNIGAAVGTAKAIEHFYPDLVLFVGVAGGIKGGMRHGEVVVASRVYNYHGGKAEAELYARPLAFPISHKLDQAVRDAMRGAWFVDAAANVPPDQPPVRLKPIAAGEVVVASTDSETFRHIKQHYNDAVAVDMESAGMYEVAYRYEDVPALAVRGISDLLDDKSPEADADLQPMASKHAAAFAFAVLGAIHPGDLKAKPAATGPAPAPATHLGDLIARVPPNVAAELERARDGAPEAADRLLARLGSEAASPSDLVVRLLDERPPWLASCSSPRIWASVGEFAAAHGVGAPTVDAFVRAAELDGTDAPRWMARAALAAAGDDRPAKAKELLEWARRIATGPHPFVKVVEAAIEASADGDASAVIEAAEAYTGDDALVEMMKGLALSTVGRRADALETFESAFENHPANTAATVELVRLLLARYLNDESESPLADLERARELALQARDLRRGWRGDSAEAAALAAQACSFAGDLEGVSRISLPSPDGEATETEAASDGVRIQAAYAALHAGDAQRGLELAERISDPLERDLVQADCFKKLPGSEDLAKDVYRRALEEASGSHRRIRAYFGLAELGEWPLPGLGEIAGQDPEVHDLIVAEAELARGDTEGAIRRYRKWRASSTALDALVDAYVRAERVDDAVEALLDGAVRHHNPGLRVRAARVLNSFGRYEDAESEARHAMDALPVGSRARRELRKLRVELAARLGDWPGVEEQARAGLEEGIELPVMRWALVAALYNQRQPEAALKAMVREPTLEPRSEQEALLAVNLYRLGPKSAEAVRSVLDLADLFAASEQVSAAAFMAAHEIAADLELPVGLLGRLRTASEDFFRRFPESELLERIEVDDEFQNLTDHLEKTLVPGAGQQEDVLQGVIAGRLPYGFVSAFAGRTYAEALIKRAAGFLPVASADESTLAVEREAAEEALDGAVVTEASALHVLGLASLDPGELLANFSRVLVPGVVLDDAIAAREFLSLRSTALMGWDAASNRPTLTEFSEEQAEGWAVEAVALVDRLRAYCEVFSPRGPDQGGRVVPERARPWALPVEAARKKGLPLYSDDFVLRAMARSEGVPAFGTLSLLNALADNGRIEENFLRDATMSLRRNYAADLPFDAEQILALAAEDGWQAGPGAFAFARPALWQDPQRALSLYQECMREVLRHDETALPAWCASATAGFARGLPAPVAAQRAGTILAYTILMGSVLSGGLRADLFSPSLQASRRAARALGLEDTLPPAVEVLKGMMEEAFGIAQTAPAFARLAEGLDAEDRTAALQVFLRPPRP
jgi:5'-methylthioadenosine/S-adenosylhomocysteine nucleosidase